MARLLIVVLALSLIALLSVLSTAIPAKPTYKICAEQQSAKIRRCLSGRDRIHIHKPSVSEVACMRAVFDEVLSCVNRDLAVSQVSRASTDCVNACDAAYFKNAEEKCSSEKTPIAIALCITSATNGRRPICPQVCSAPTE